MKIKCVLFDFGRVLGNFDHMMTCRRLANYSSFSPEEIRETIFDGGLEKTFDEGGTFNDFFRSVKSGIRSTDSLGMIEFKDIWGNIFTPNPGMDKVVETIRPDIKKMVLSNTNSVHWEYIMRLPIMLKHFSHPENNILSFCIGRRKPSGKMFRIAIRNSGVKPEEILYIDDIQKYCIAGTKYGMRAVPYDCRQKSAEDLREELIKFEIFR